MTEKWKPGTYTDKFTSAVHALVAKRVEAGATEKVEPMEESGASEPSNVVDLTALLRQSLRKKASTSEATRSTAAKGAKAKKPAAKQATQKRA